MGDSSLDMSTASLLSQHQRSESNSSSSSSSSSSSNNGGNDIGNSSSAGRGGIGNKSNRSITLESQLSTTTSDLDASLASSASSQPSVPSPPSPSLTVPPKAISEEEPTAVVVPGEDPDREEQGEPSRPLPVLPGEGSGGWYAQLKRLVYALGRVMFRDNTLPLLLNVLYHGLAARALLARSNEPVQRTVQLPVNNGVNQRVVMSAVHVAAGALRALGTMHLALTVVPVLALKEKRLNDEKNALMVLSVASVGRVWAEARSIYHTGAAWRAIREVGSFDTLMLFISLVALVKSLRR